MWGKTELELQARMTEHLRDIKLLKARKTNQPSLSGERTLGERCKNSSSGEVVWRRKNRVTVKRRNMDPEISNASIRWLQCEE